jgi:putative Holliday junction resolvase
MARTLGVDYGEVRIGLALSDARGTLALPFKTVEAGKNLKTAVVNVKSAIEIYLKEIECVIIGLPLHLSGKESPMSEKARAFAKLLGETLAIPVIMLDERLTSAYVEKSMKEMQLTRKQRSGKVDTSAAAIILQNYLDSKKNK